MLKREIPMIEKQKRMGGKLKVTKVRTKPTIVNINKLEIRELNPDEIGFQNSVFASIVKGRHKSKPIRTLLDTGATYSVIHYGIANGENNPKISSICLESFIRDHW